MTAKLGIVLLALTMALGAGCKSAEEKVCDHVRELAEEAGEAGEYSNQECQEHLDEINGGCTNPDDVFECILDKDDLRDFPRCLTRCDRKDDE